MIAIIDYGAGNLFSVKNALDYLGIENIITKDKCVLNKANALILPGVGAFPDAMKMLGEVDLIDSIIKNAQIKPFLGICLGMQMLFDSSEEFGHTQGLGLISGQVKLLDCTDEKIPHIGWNELVINKKEPLLEGIESGDSVYFVHSYKAFTDDENISAYCEYGTKLPALVQKGNVFGAQFHPEKSGKIGLRILKNFAELV